MNRVIKFRGKILSGEWVVGMLSLKDGIFYISNKGGYPFAFMPRPESIGEYIGLVDRKGNLIFEGDIILIRKPGRSFQDHEPNYREWLEPVISDYKYKVEFIKGVFCLQQIHEYNENFEPIPVWWDDIQHDERSISEAIGDYERKEWYGEEGNLKYLLDTYKLPDLQSLIEYTSAFEVIGNIHDNPEHIQTS